MISRRARGTCVECRFEIGTNATPRRLIESASRTGNALESRDESTGSKGPFEGPPRRVANEVDAYSTGLPSFGFNRAIVTVVREIGAGIISGGPERGRNEKSSYRIDPGIRSNRDYHETRSCPNRAVLFNTSPTSKRMLPEGVGRVRKRSKTRTSVGRYRRRFSCRRPHTRIVSLRRQWFSIVLGPPPKCSTPENLSRPTWSYIYGIKKVLKNFSRPASGGGSQFEERCNALSACERTRARWTIKNGTRCISCTIRERVVFLGPYDCHNEALDKTADDSEASQMYTIGWRVSSGFLFWGKWYKRNMSAYETRIDGAAAGGMRRRSRVAR